MKDLPENMAYAAYWNVNKLAINNGVFAEHIEKNRLNQSFWTIAIPHVNNPIRWFDVEIKSETIWQVR
jgi:hypothetical protein